MSTEDIFISLQMHFEDQQDEDIQLSVALVDFIFEDSNLLQISHFQFTRASKNVSYQWNYRLDWL